MSAAAKVLLVEDDADLREALVDALLAEAILAAVACNGAEALGYLRKAPPPKLILLDLMMPVMDGMQFCREQQQVDLLKHIPVFILSADREIQAKALALALGVAGFLRKPVDLFDLLEVIRRYLT